MEEKKQIKVGLGTAICIFIIILLVIALAGSIIYYNSKIDKENNNENQQAEVDKTPQNSNLEDGSKENKNEIVEDVINVEEVYVYSNGSNNKQGDETSADKFTKIGFSSDGKFVIDMEGYYDTVTGKYELIGENIRRCKLEKYSFDEPDGRITHSVADANWFVDLKIVDDNKIKVVSNDLMDKDGEFAVSFGIAVTIDKEFTKYDIKDFIGTWKSSHAYKLNDTEYNSYYEEVDLYDVLGRSAAQYGSTFTLNEDGSFKDYIHPVTEADMYRDGEYTFNNGNEFHLKYVDGDKEAKIYIINENTIVHESGYYRIVLVK